MATSLTRGAYARLALILGTLAAFGPLSIDMYLPGLPAIAREFGTSAAAAQQTLSVFFIGLAAGQLLYGPLSDRLGRRRPVLFGCAIYALAGLACALAASIPSLIVLRLCQALGGCVGIVISRSVVRDLFDQRESARMYSVLTLVMGLAPITAPLIGGQLLGAFGWRSIFVVLGGFGALCFALVLFGLPETLSVERRDRASLGRVVRAYGGMLADGRFMGFALASGLAFASMFAYISGSPYVFIELNGVPPERFGLLFGINATGLIAASQVNRWLLGRYSGVRILVATLAVTACAGLLLVIVAATGLGGFPGLLAVLFVCIASLGLVQPNATAAAMAPYGRQAGSASAMLGATQFVFGALAGALVGLLHNGTALPMAGVMGLCSSLAFIFLHVLALRPPRTAEVPQA
jgi:DHA1 family bicyclomycin/chloramphenicol resistance-like MFS transporter